jgi:hypothetical protein
MLNGDELTKYNLDDDAVAGLMVNLNDPGRFIAIPLDISETITELTLLPFAQIASVRVVTDSSGDDVVIEEGDGGDQP